MRTIRKVLVVDDDPVVGRSFDRVLSGKGYAVITARDGNEALNKLSNENYDVVFTDIRMPGMSGLEVAERVKASQPWLPVVIVTGYGTDANEARARAAGVSGFLHKPLSPEMIEGSAEKALRERDAPAKTETEAAAAEAPAVETAGRSRNVGRAAKNIALFFAAPFVGLAYILVFPFVGLAMLVWISGKALMKYDAPRETALVAKNIGLFAAAPFLGLVYILFFPFVGLAMLAWIGGRALLKRPGAE
jgi:CheY-like chemotaxis protein